MKKTLLVLIASVVLLANAGNAQEDLRNTLNFGPKAGLNLSNVYDTGDENFDADAKLGLAAGVFVSIPFNTLFGVQPELLFSQKGFRASGNFLGSEYTFTRTLNYIDLPLLFAFKPAPMITILAGPQYSYLLNRKDVFTNSFMDIENEDEFHNENLRKNTICLLGGVDVNINRIVIGARAGWDLFQNNSDGTSQTPRYKNVWLQATVGFRI